MIDEQDDQIDPGTAGSRRRPEAAPSEVIRFRIC